MQHLSTSNRITDGSGPPFSPADSSPAAFSHLFPHWPCTICQLAWRRKRGTLPVQRLFGITGLLYAIVHILSSVPGGFTPWTPTRRLSLLDLTFSTNLSERNTPSPDLYLIVGRSISLRQYGRNESGEATGPPVQRRKAHAAPSSSSKRGREYILSRPFIEEGLHFSPETGEKLRIEVT